MKQIFLLIGFFLFQKAAAAQQPCPIIPLPAKTEMQHAVFVLNQYTPILVSDEAVKPVAHYLQAELLRRHGLALSIQSETSLPAITIAFSNKKEITEGAYSLQMSDKGVTITASSTAGAFYGVVSLLQLVAQSNVAKGNVSLACWNITDAPLYQWRGLMLDESRHFFGKEKVKSILDWMAFYKLNRFHWHLTDEPAWRLEIKKYPLLAFVGGIGSYTNPNVPAQYYTQEEIKEIVAYAAERQITVIPEIDMPGHATAANRAYPQYSGGGSEKHPEFTFNPGKEETYQYLTNILRETNVLFPSAMLHLGGDEVSFGNTKWAANTAIQSLMQRNKLANVKEVEHYFMQRMADSVYAMNAKLLAWDEMADLNLPKDKTIIFWWRQEKPGQLTTALNKGYQTVLCPRLPLYFDFVQDSTHTLGRKWNKSFNAIQNVYDFTASALPAITKANSKQILGIQANLWTETIPNEQRLDYMLFPRIAALAEAAWTPDNRKNFHRFKQTLRTHFPLYQQAGLSYYKPF